jgi:hypothetical protein
VRSINCFTVVCTLPSPAMRLLLSAPLCLFISWQYILTPFFCRLTPTCRSVLFYEKCSSGVVDLGMAVDAWTLSWIAEHATLLSSMVSNHMHARCCATCYECGHPMHASDQLPLAGFCHPPLVLTKALAKCSCVDSQPCMQASPCGQVLQSGQTLFTLIRRCPCT